jgi:endo-1,3(4)-beta-glucanase
VKVVSTAPSSTSWWSIDELDLYTSGSVAATSCSASVSGSPLSRSGWTASANTNSAASDAPANAIDGNTGTRYSSDAAQAPGMAFEVNMGSAKTFDKVDMDATDWPGDYARGYNVEVSSNGTNWTTVASCTGTGNPEIASFAPQTAQYVQVVTTASASPSWWSIGEFNLYDN